ncbi:MAG: hypothetical protein R2813_11835 [Flavobacteriales bacterium]
MEPQSHLFSLRQGTHYLNCAYKAPLLKSAEAAALQALERERNPQDYNSQSFFEGVGDARDLFAGLVHCHPSQVALISSVSYGLASVFRNVPYRKGQHAIVVDKEFPSGYMAVKRWCDAHGAEAYH